MSDGEIQSLVRQLNSALESTRKLREQHFNYKTAIINEQTIMAFKRYLLTQSHDQRYINTYLNILRKKVLQFFINEMQLASPNLWKRYETEFLTYIIATGKTPDYLRRMVDVANRFLKFLHSRYPDSINFAKLEYPAATAIRHLERPRRISYITPLDFEHWCNEVRSELVPFFKLCYHFGLRRSEALALQPYDVRETALVVERQQANTLVETKLPKGGKTREVPYYNVTPKQTYEWIMELHKVHKDTISALIKSECERLNIDLVSHDFRRTFLTNLAKDPTQGALAARFAAGHADSRTTDLYMQDHRALNLKVWRPQ